MNKSAIKQHRSQKVSHQLEGFVESLLVELDRNLDKRLVRTFLLTLHAILKFRHNSVIKHGTNDPGTIEWGWVFRKFGATGEIGDHRRK
jgi:hypothetical protein